MEDDEEEPSQSESEDGSGEEERNVFDGDSPIQSENPTLEIFHPKPVTLGE